MMDKSDYEDEYIVAKLKPDFFLRYLCTFNVLFFLNFVSSFNNKYVQVLEILASIFKLLKVHHRKNVRLTCRSWRDACNASEIIANEKFVFRPHSGENMEKLSAQIVECQNLRSYWEFHCVRLFELTATVWERCGYRILSLLVYICEVCDETILNIIVHCSNLRHFRLEVPAFPDLYDRAYGNGDQRLREAIVAFDRDLMFCSDETIGELVEWGCKRRYLTSLELYIPALISNEALRNLFRIFPCIRTFGQGQIISEESDSDFYSVFESTSTLGEWILPPMIESLTVKRDDICDSWKLPNSILFKEFSTFLDMDRIFDLRPLFDFFSKQTELVKLELNFLNEDSGGRMRIIFHILKNVPNLKELKIHSVDLMAELSFFTHEEFNNFLDLSSKLESIVTNERFHLESFDRSIPPKPFQFVEYAALKKLELLHHSSTPALTCEILKRCPRSLQFLSLAAVDDDVMRIICEVHTELRDLHLNLRRAKGASSRSISQHPFKKLRDLQAFHILDVSPDVLEALLSELEFPRLRSFEFYCGEWANNKSFYNGTRYSNAFQVFGSLLEGICRNSPYLEYLYLRSCAYHISDYREHFEKVKMNDLLWLKIEGVSFFVVCDDCYESAIRDQHPVNKFLQSVFAECPSLCLVDLFKDPYKCVFSYDRYSNQVKRSPHFNTFIPLSESPL